MQTIGNAFEHYVSKACEADNRHGTEIIMSGDSYVCALCGGIRKQIIVSMDKEYLVPVPCECMLEAERVRAEREADVQKRYAISDLRAECIRSPVYAEFVFSCDNGSNPKITQTCRRYVDKWGEIREKNIGLLFYGGVGTGKTFHAVAIANELISRGVGAYVVTGNEILLELGSTFDKRQYVKRITSYPLLVIDDLGAERATDYGISEIHNVIDERWLSGKPLIVTTNVPIEQIKNPADIRAQRIYDRVLQMCHPVKFDGISQRRAALKADFAGRDKLLKGGTE